MVAKVPPGFGVVVEEYVRQGDLILIRDGEEFVWSFATEQQDWCPVDDYYCVARKLQEGDKS